MRRFEQKIEERLRAMSARCQKQRRAVQKVEREVGRMLGKNTRAARLFEVTVEQREDGGDDAGGGVGLEIDGVNQRAGTLLVVKGERESLRVLEQVGASVEARTGVTTGISASDRARTIQVLASDKSGPDDVVMPGHVPPLMALTGGVLMRVGRAEATVDLVRLAGMRPCAALCTILGEDGGAARLDELLEFAERHNLLICSIGDLVSYRVTSELLVQRVADLIQVGDADAAARAFRVAFRIASSMLDAEQ